METPSTNQVIVHRTDDLTAWVKVRLSASGYFDLDAGLGACRTAARYLARFRDFALDYRASIDHLKAHPIAEGDGEARRLAHSLKGGSAFLGIIGIQEPADQLELAILRGAEATTITHLIDRIDQRYEEIAAMIREITMGEEGHG